nr:helix-turn-helix domain-containing protein [Pasteurella testudinis]
MKENKALASELDRYYSLWRESNHLYEEWSKLQGLSFNSVMVLYFIRENTEHCTQKMISQKWLIPKQTVNMILKDLEKRGFILLVPLPSDKRNKHIQFTRAGEEYAESIVSELRKKELFAMERIGIERIKAFNDCLAQYIALFNSGEKNVSL